VTCSDASFGAHSPLDCLGKCKRQTRWKTVLQVKPFSECHANLHVCMMALC